MQDVNRIRGANDIQDTKRPRSLSYPDFTHAGSDRAHRFPIVGRFAVLQLAELEARFLPSDVRESSDGIPAAANPDNWNHASSMRNPA